jgi:sec-independent protein translocase protein TatA
MTPLLLGDLGTPELVVILVVVMLVFGGQKLPELARGSGRALRIFKAEMSADDEPEDEAATSAAPSSDLETKQAAELRALERRHESERRALHDDDGGSTQR